MKQNIIILSIYGAGFLLLNAVIVLLVVLNPDLITNEEAFTQLGITSNSLFYFTIFLTLILVFRKYLGEQLKDFFVRWKKTVPVVVIGILLIYLFIMVIGILFTLLGVDSTAQNQDQINAMLESASPFQLFMLLAFITVLAPVVEEIVFRKGVYGIVGTISMKLIKHKDAFIDTKKAHTIASVIAIIISSLLFGAIHSLDVFILLYATLGSALAIVYFMSNKNIYTSILVHMIYNTISIVITLLFL